MYRCSCAAAARWWRPTANPMHGGPFCRNTGRVLEYSELRRPPIVVIGETSPTPVPVRVDEASNFEDRQRAPLGLVVYDDGVDYGPGSSLTLDGSAWILHSSFDMNRDR